MSKYNTIILPGGGIKAFSLLGGLQYMFDKNIFDEHVKYYSGTSIGSVICYFLAIGYTPIEIVAYSITNKVFDITLINNIESLIKGDGIYNFSFFYNHFEKMTIDKIGYMPTLKNLYENMNKVLYTCTYNVTKKKKEYLSYLTHPDMLCIDAIRLSCSLPFVFNDCIYNEEYFIDGGFVDNCPFSIVTDDDVSAIIFTLEQKEEDEYKSFIDKLYNIMTIPISELQMLQFSSINIKHHRVTLVTDPIKIYDFNIDNSFKLELFSSGYNLTKKQLTF